MREKITSRVSRIISGGFNALVDAVENAAPEAVMEQALKEIDDAIEEVRNELGKAIANKHLTTSRLTQVNTKCRDLAEQIELAVGENRDDLAEVGIAQQLDIEAQIPILESQISDLTSSEVELEGYISALKGKKGEMQEELRLFKASRVDRPTGGANTGNENDVPTIESRVGKAESAFDRILGRATGLRSGTTAPDRTTASALNELEEMARTNRIKERLAAIKGKKGNS